MIQPQVLVLTGVPGTGKSTAAAALKKKYDSDGKRILFINDYPILKKWADENRGRADLVTWMIGADGQEFFDIVPDKYRDISTIVAEQIAEMIRQLITEGDYDVFIVESARGAGPEGMRDTYKEHLLSPLQRVLGDTVSFTIIETRVSDTVELARRMNERLAVEPGAAPAFVADKYISRIEGAQSSKSAAAELGMPHILIDNSNSVDDRETAVVAFRILLAEAMLVLAEGNLLGVREDPEGQIRSGSPEKE